MQESVQDGCREDLVPGEQSRSVPNGLVGGHHHRSATVAIADRAEEQHSLVSGRGVIAHLVDHQQSRGHVLLALETDRRQGGVVLESGHQLVEPAVLCREAELDGLDARSDAQMRFSDTGSIHVSWQGFCACPGRCFPCLSTCDLAFRFPGVCAL